MSEKTIEELIISLMSKPVTDKCISEFKERVRAQEEIFAAEEKARRPTQELLNMTYNI